MELMPGQTLADLVREQGPLPVGEAVNKVLDVIAGLQAAHRLGFIHRDIKPSNCFLGPDGRVKVGDFGLAKTLMDTPDQKGAEATRPQVDLELTQQGMFLGTVLFASPEQLRGEALDFRSDVYSVSATLYYLLSGRAPHEGRSLADVAEQTTAGPPTPLTALRPDIPTGIDRIVRRGLGPDPERRWQDLEALRVALLRFGPGQLARSGLGLRLLAWGIDFLAALLLSLLFYQVLITWWPTLGLPSETPRKEFKALLTPSHREPASYLVVLVPELLYFTLLEGVWGCALGKWLCRLRVTRQGSDRPPGLARALLRTAGFLMLLYLPLEIVLVLPMDCITQIVLSMLASSKLGSLLLIMSTMRERNGFRGLHEFASGTCVLRLFWPGRGEEDRFGGRRWRNQLSERLTWPGELPVQVGPFQIEGTLAWGGDSGGLVAQDRILGRKVLLWLRRHAEPLLPAARRDVNRPTRPRWLGEGTEGEWRWDAFAIQPGCSLDRFLAAGPLGWARSRSLLQQLADELVAAGADATVPGSLAVAQVWVQRGGQIQLLDLPLGRTEGKEVPPEERSLALLGQVARQALAGERQPLPLHASTLLARLIGAEQPYKRVEEVQTDLAFARDRPTRVGRLHRGLHLLVQACLFVVAFVFAQLLAALTLGKRTDTFPVLILQAVAGILWASAVRGGPSFSLCGLALVGRDGRRAGRWRSAWRAFLAWVQGYGLVALVSIFWTAFLKPHSPQPANQQGVPFEVFLISVCLYTLLLVWLPRRTLHDRLAGTYVVPE
jgi:hypothetical protein